MKSIIIILCILVCSLNNAQAKQDAIYRVSKVIDGDTIELQNGVHVRLIGIDAPEMRDNNKLSHDILKRRLSKRVQLAMGLRSYQFTKKLVEGKQVRLEFDVLKHDTYNRILAYVYLTDGKFINAEILKNGYAYAYPIKPDLRYAAEFRQYYLKAKEQHRGLWKNGGHHATSFKWFNHN